MVTREEYLEALDIIETYHRQLQPNIVKRGLTPIMKWDKWGECSLRLKNVLLNIRDTKELTACKEEFIENIQIHEMKKLPNCGIKTLHEFIELRGY